MTTFELWVLVLACGVATFAWRFLGVVFARRIDPEGAGFQWITCVSYAMVAALVLRMVVLPDNDLATVPLEARLGAVAVAFAAYFTFGSALLPGVLAGSSALALAVWWLGV